MSNAWIVFQKMLVLLAMMLTGYFSFKKDILNKDACARLSKFVVAIVNPLLIIDGVIGKETVSDPSLLWQNVFMVSIYYVLLFLIGFPVAMLLRPKKSEASLYRLMLLFSNVGFMGIPVITGLYGEGCVLYIAFYILGYNLLLYTYGMHLVSKSKSDENEDNGNTSDAPAESPFKKIINPGVIACIIAILLFTLQLPVPAPVIQLVNGLGQTAVPLSMILIGASMAQQNFKALLTDKRVYAFLGIRLLLLPILFALVLQNFALDKQVAGVVGLMMAMPVGSIVVLLATDKGADEKLCMKGCVLSTLLSVITIPIVAIFLP
ncbi:MAG: AEC family transporter [Lachnospiraceae bacterium]|nr:AEC family transporter [Lachnospiraceae bacterium]